MAQVSPFNLMRDGGRVICIRLVIIALFNGIDGGVHTNYVHALKPGN